ncbi:hypothetical protein [Sphingobium sp.]|nr:hypothetical protein [Sphingobium sp.]
MGRGSVRDSIHGKFEVVFGHIPIGEERSQATIKIRAARNRGGITAYMEGGAAVTPYKKRFQFITAFIPVIWRQTGQSLIGHSQSFISYLCPKKVTT